MGRHMRELQLTEIVERPKRAVGFTYAITESENIKLEKENGSNATSASLSRMSLIGGPA